MHITSTSLHNAAGRCKDMQIILKGQASWVGMPVSSRSVRFPTCKKHAPGSASTCLTLLPDFAWKFLIRNIHFLWMNLINLVRPPPPPSQTYRVSCRSLGSHCTFLSWIGGANNWPQASQNAYVHALSGALALDLAKELIQKWSCLA